MFTRFAIAVLLGLCGAASVHAADLESLRATEYGWYARRAGMIGIYDYEPGVVVRAYWQAPWGDRHYFPHGRTAPRLGRRENLSLRGHALPAQSFHRSWSNEAALVSERRSYLRPRTVTPRQHEQLNPDPRMTPELK